MNELDKIFRSKLENHTEEFSQQSWDKIQSRLVRQKSKPKKFPWLWMSLASLIVVGTLYLFIDTSSSGGIITAETSNNLLSEESNTLDSSSEELVEYASIESDDKKNLIKTKGESTNVNINQSKNLDKVSKEANLLASMESTFIENQQRIKSKANGKEIGAPSNYNKVNSIDPVAISDYEDSKVNNLMTIKNPTISNTTSKNEKYSIENNREINIRPIRTIGVSSFSKLHSVEEKNNIELDNSMLDEFRQDCPSFVTDRTGVYLDFYVSHELPFSSLSAKDSQFDSYKSLRAETEGPSYSFSAGARLTLMLPNGLGLKTGFNYSQLNEKFSYVDPESVMRKQVITITSVDGMEVRDTNFIEIPGTREIVSTNKYKSFDLPLLLSYEWDIRERTYMTVNGGVYLNLLFKESGKILDPSGEVIDISGGGDGLSVFKNNIGLSLFGSVGLHYRWNNAFDLILEPNVRMLVKSATVEGYPLEHKWITGGLITGVRYNF